LRSFCQTFGWQLLYNGNIFMCQAFYFARKITSLAQKHNFKVALGTISHNVSLWENQCESLTCRHWNRQFNVGRESESQSNERYCGTYRVNWLFYINKNITKYPTVTQFRRSPKFGDVLFFVIHARFQRWRSIMFISHGQFLQLEWFFCAKDGDTAGKH
jgi:hypothetical protein